MMYVYNVKNRWTVIYYETPDGKCPVHDFIDSRTINNKAKILGLIEYLERMGPHLPRPYADTLDNGIHELRIKLSGNQIRILYFFCYKNFIVLTHPFIKKTKSIPEKEINKAVSLREDFLIRFTEQDLRQLNN